MVRRAVLGGGSLNPFGGGGTDFGAFNILNAGNEAYLAFVKVETAWNAGKTTDSAYLAALEVYANAQDAESSDWISVHARLEQAKYQVGRNVLLSQIERKTKTLADLVDYDRGKLTGLVENSQEYEQRLGLYQSSQAKLIAEEEKKKVDLYQAGKMTTTQLQKWYQDVLTGPTIDRNPELETSLKDRISELGDRVQGEKDSKMLSDFSDGKVTTHDFLAYATAAKARYAAGTTQAIEWGGRIQDARENSAETALLYRYNLSQQYAQLQEFVKSNSGGRSGGTSTSTSKRVVLGTDGQWHTVTSTTTKATAPTAAQQAAHAKLQVELNDAKAQMAAIAKKVSGVGGFVQSSSVLKYYTGKLGKVARGSAEWYAIQGKIDNVNDRIHAESVSSKQGIRITYPSSGGSGGGGTSSSSGGVAAAGGTAKATAGGGGGGITLDTFMRAIARQESGGRYDARNSSSGAYGKYQIMPANWSSWAQRAGLPGNAPQTPENQEKVAKAAFARLAGAYHNDWSRVAAAWFAGVAGSANPAAWGPRTKRYVSAIMSHLGTTAAAVAPSGSAGSAGGSGSSPHAAAPVLGRSTGVAASQQKPTTGQGPLSVITSVNVGGRKTQTEQIGTHNTGFPANLDGRAFEKFYANYENAFESGAESFVDSSSGRPVAYFIGDDPTERIDRMRQLDDLRVRLYDTRAVAYQGTPSELTAQNARNNAYQDVARHEYLIIDTASKTTSGSTKLNAATNPLASGIRVLDKTMAAITSNLAMAEAAYKRGDLTGAYALFQMAQALKDANGAQMQLIAGYASSTDAKVAAITRATGGIDPAEALGADKGGAFTKDLDRLHGFDVEITSLFTDSTETLNELKSHLKLQPDGSPTFDLPGDPKAQLVLTDDTYFLLKPNGEVSVESKPPGYHNGQMTYKDDKTVTVKVKVGSHVIDAQAAFQVGEVGSFVDPNDPTHLMPIMGKYVQQKIDGKWVTFYENPLAPGSAQGWSATPWVYATGANFKATPDGAGGSIYSWGGGQGNTYKLIFDKATGTYAIARDNPGGIFSSPVVDEFVATLGDADAASLITGGGFVRQGGGGSFDGVPQAVFGFTDENQYQDWLRSFQPPALANLGKTPTGAELYGDPSSIKARAYDRPAYAYGDPSSIAARAYGSTGTGDRAALAGKALAAAANYGDPSSVTARAYTKPPEAYGDPSSIKARADLPGGQSDAIAQRAVLPRNVDPEWLTEQRQRTSSIPPAVKPPPRKAPAPKPPVVPVKPASTRRSSARRPLPKPVAPPPVVNAGGGGVRKAL